MNADYDATSVRSASSELEVDVVIAVHTAQRPIARAVSSVLHHTSASVRVTVVAHNIDVEIVRRNLGTTADDPRLRLLSLFDGISSPAGPLNLGLAAATAPFVTVMGSDDEFQPGAIDSWVAQQRTTQADMVIADIRHSDGRREKSPPVRPTRRVDLDPVLDRLVYRSAPLGLISRSRFGDFRFAEGLPSGEDLPYVTRLWFDGGRIVLDSNGPAYLVHDDGDARVTVSPRAVAADFAYLPLILGARWYKNLSVGARQAIAIKLIRVHLFDAVINRRGVEWPGAERVALADVAKVILASSPKVEELLSRADRALLDAIMKTGSPTDTMVRLSTERSAYARPRAVLTRKLRFVLHRQGPLRTLAAGFLLR